MSDTGNDLAILKRALADIGLPAGGWRLAGLEISEPTTANHQELEQAIAAFPIAGGWVCTTSAVAWTEDGKDWKTTKGESFTQPLADRLLSAELASDDGRSLSIQHLGDGKWRLVSVTKRPGTSHLVRHHRQKSIINGLDLAYDVFHAESDDQYRPVAQLFLGLVKERQS